MDGGGSCSGGYFKLYEELELQEFQDPSRLRMKDSPSIAATASLSRSTAILLLLLQVLLKPRRYTEWRERSDCLQLDKDAFSVHILEDMPSFVQFSLSTDSAIDRLVKENKVVAFIKGSRSAPLCGFSQRVVGILENQGVDYESVDVLDEGYNSGLRETLKKYSNWPTFPQIFVNGELLGGFDILSSMQEKGELSSLSKK
ncbi:hypothetical protein ACFX13_033692 [Malus domestica]